ncbi:MAG: NAD-dependent epimerase/dehydratase family protein [Marinobacter sp.]
MTGATGFIGSHLAKSLDDLPDIELTCAVRKVQSSSFGREVVVDGLGARTDWSTFLEGQQVVIHAAARAHLMKNELSDSLLECRKVNVDGTLNLAQQAASAGVRRFVFISSIGVNGQNSSHPFTELNAPNPVDALSKLKHEAEVGLWKVQEDTGMELVVIRPALVYGPGAPGNFGALVNWVAKGFPLPLGAVHNLRSFIALDNLIDLITTCIDHPAAADQVFLASDGNDLSTTDLLNGVAEAMGKHARLIPIPTSLLMLGARAIGKEAMAQRLLGSLQLDISKARDVLGWEPPVSVKQGLDLTVSDRLSSAQHIGKTA